VAEESDREFDFAAREIVLRADFSARDEADCISVSLRFVIDGPRAPRKGEWVYLMDDRGVGCPGQIQSINGWSARIKPDWSSWDHTQQPPPVSGSS
jgi:hypothetical protein